ncbi:MAG: NAD-dependent deacylase [Candidatus Hydrogenedentales bacterium]
MNNLSRAADYVRRGKCVIASTGAGMSVESGIPDFRSAGGIWEKYPPEEYATIEAFLAAPGKVWRFWNELAAQFSSCRPHAGHRALAELEQAGRLSAVITQNVDNLHQEAGSRRVIEYHGNSRRVVCLDCRAERPFDAAAERPAVPRCGCGGLLKPDVVMFGEMIPQRAMLQAEAYARAADVVLIVGTSAQVYPAAELPLTAKRNGATLIEFNVSETDFTPFVDVFVQRPAGETLPELARQL